MCGISTESSCGLPDKNVGRSNLSIVGNGSCTVLHDRTLGADAIVVGTESGWGFAGLAIPWRLAVPGVAGTILGPGGDCLADKKDEAKVVGALPTAMIGFGCETGID